MRQTTGTRKSPGEQIVKDIKRATRKHYSSEEKIRIVLDGLRGEDSIAELCRREGIFDDLLARAFACSTCLSHLPLLSGYDEPRTLSYQITLFGPISADVRQSKVRI